MISYRRSLIAVPMSFSVDYLLETWPHNTSLTEDFSALEESNKKISSESLNQLVVLFKLLLTDLLMMY